MSSKVLPSDDPQLAVPIAWRRVDVPGRAPSYIPPPPPASSKPLAPADTRPVEDKLREDKLFEDKLREAHAAGVREGEAAGRSRAAAEMQAAIERLARSIEEISGLRARLRREAEGDLVRLTLAIARRILRRELAVDPDALHGLVLGALEKLQGQEICRVRVHPSHAALVSACLRQMAPASPVEVLPDPSREPGAVIFETGRGNLDASVESQLREIERGLADRLRTSR
jgi:flagellar assembly protein FliH